VGCRLSLALSAVSTSCAFRSIMAPRNSPPSQNPPSGITAVGSSSVTPCTIPRILDTRWQLWMVP
jgi:hypothetical protein